MRNIGCLWRGDLSPRAWTSLANGMGVKISSGMVHLARESAQEAREGGVGEGPRGRTGPLCSLRRRVHVLAPLRRMRRTQAHGCVHLFRDARE